MKAIVLALMILSNEVIASSALSTFKSNKLFVDTIEVAETFIKEKGLTLFAKIDHQSNAQNAGLSLLPNTVLIFGNPKVGTPLMVSGPTIGIDLPVKVHIHQDQYKNVFVSYNDPNYLASKHKISKNHPSFQKMLKVLGLLEKEILKKN